MPLTASAAEFPIEGEFSGVSAIVNSLPVGIYKIEIYLDGYDDPVLVVSDFDTGENLCFNYSFSTSAYEDVLVSICYETNRLQIDLVYPEADFPGRYVIQPYVEEAQPSLLGTMFGVFSSIGSWLILQIGVLSGLFWNSATGALTVIGVLSLAGAAVGVALLFVFLVVRFLRFK